ncbi:MAG: DegV family protein, partial [Anaerolineales bacterium]
MQIVSDRGMDLDPEQLSGITIHQVPLRITLNGKSYRSGEDISPEEFFRLLSETDGYPTTSQPSPGDFA